MGWLCNPMPAERAALLLQRKSRAEMELLPNYLLSVFCPSSFILSTGIKGRCNACARINSHLMAFCSGRLCIKLGDLEHLCLRGCRE